MARISDYMWKCTGAIQGMMWFFALPALVKPHWEGLWYRLSPLQREVVLNETGLFIFAVYAIMMLPIYAGNYSFFEQYKISDKPWDWRNDKKEVRDSFWALTKRSVWVYLFNYCGLVPALTMGKYYVMGSYMSFSTADWPPYKELLFNNLALSLIHEFGFYWTHRLAHKPIFYRFHKMHHEYKQNTILAAMYEHPLDYIWTIGLPPLVAVVIVKPHSFTLFQWVIWLLVANLDDHCGYAFPWSPVRWFPFSGATEMHEFHHSNNMGCFASKTDIYDKIFDSEKPYLEWQRKRLAAKKEA